MREVSNLTLPKNFCSCLQLKNNLCNVLLSLVLTYVRKWPMFHSAAYSTSLFPNGMSHSNERPTVGSGRGETTRGEHFAYWRLNGLIFLYLSQQTKDTLSVPSVKYKLRFTFSDNMELLKNIYLETILMAELYSCKKIAFINFVWSPGLSSPLSLFFPKVLLNINCTAALCDDLIPRATISLFHFSTVNFGYYSQIRSMDQQIMVQFLRNQLSGFDCMCTVVSDRILVLYG